MNIKMNIKQILLIILLFVGRSVFAQPDLAKIDTYISNAQMQWNVPGLAVAIVKDGQIIFEKGYGVLEEGKTEKIDENTLFAIASNTKAFIATSIGTLVEDGKLSWKDPVRNTIPYFTLYDNYASSEATVEDLLCHRLGLGTFSGDVIWYKSNFPVADVIRKAEFIPKAYGFRGGYGYSNVMYITAGEVIHQASGKNWNQYIRDTFFNPLGMSRTQTSIDGLKGLENVATPHKYIDGKHTAIKWATWNNSGAAGGIISSVHDMSQWMMLHLNHGVWKSDTIFKRSTQDELWYPHNNYKITSRSREYLPSRHFNGCGLGFGLYDLHGKFVATHSGGYDGMYSRVAMVPEDNLGIVVLTNSMTGIGTALTYYIMDAFAGAEEKDWSEEMKAGYEKGVKSKQERIQKRLDAHVSGTSPSVDPGDCSGKYVDDMYGELEVKEEDGQLRLLFPSAPDLDATLTHWHYDTYKINWDNVHAWFGFGTVRFELDNNQNVTGMEFDVPNDDIFFEEIHAVKNQ